MFKEKLKAYLNAALGILIFSALIYFCNKCDSDKEIEVITTYCKIHNLLICEYVKEL